MGIELGLARVRIRVGEEHRPTEGNKKRTMEVVGDNTNHRPNRDHREGAQITWGYLET